MKNFITIVFLLLAVVGFTQDYEAKVLELNNRIDSVSGQDNEELVTKIEIERDLYIELQNAIENKDIYNTIKLKRKLKIRPSDSIDDYGNVEYINNNRGVNVKLSLPSEFTETNHDSKYLQQDMILSNINDQSFQLVIQKSDKMDMVALIERTHKNPATNKKEYKVDAFEVIEFDIKFGDETAKYKLIYYDEGYIYLSISTPYTLFDNDVNAYFNSLILNDTAIIQK